jgi:hypothetical protein
LIFGSCTVGWYTEKYRRVEGDIDDHIKRLYLQDVNMAHSKTPQITAAIRGQDMNLDGRMDRMVWGGKAKLNDDNDSNSNSNNNNNGNNDDNDGELGGTLAANEMTTNTTTNNNNNNDDADDDDDKTKRRRKRRKKRKRKVPKDASEVEEERKRKEEAEKIKSQQKKLVLQSSIAGIAVGSVAVAAVSVFFNGNGSGGRK